MTKALSEKSYTNYGGETISKPFHKNSKLSISQDQWSKILCSLILLYNKLRTIKIY